jgi:DNA-binding MarR family transcriptional regulator
MAASRLKQQPDDLDLVRAAIVELVKNDSRDLTLRQLAVFLICYLAHEAQTATKLAAALNVYKPGIARALDRLSEENLLKRVPHVSDGRSALVAKTPAETALMRDLKSAIRKAAASSPD